MNAERLNVVAKAIQQELSSTRVVEILTELTNALQNISNQQYQNILAAKRKEITAALSIAPSNSFPPAWRQIVMQIGGEGLLGSELEERLRTIIERNQITPSNALQEIRQIQQSLTNFKSGIDQVAAGLDLLRIGREELAPGEAEIGVEIPRAAVNNDLSGLEKELGELKLILGTFVEFSTGKSGPIPLRTISSTDLQFYFAAAPSAAAALAYAINLLVDAYKKVVEIRRNRNELKENGVPPGVLKPLEDYANNAIEVRLDEFTAEIEAKFFHVKDNDRKNELKVALKFSLAKLANRIDRGYHIEARIAPSSDDHTGKKDKELEEAAAIIRAAAPSMQYIRVEGAPILSLPESEQPKKSTEKGAAKKL